MATLRKRGKKWNVEVCKNNARRSKTFDTKKEAEQWGIETEIDISRDPSAPLPNKTFGELLQRYADEISVNKKGARWEEVRVNQFQKDPIADVNLRDFGKVHVVEWRDRRANKVSSSSVLREWSLLSHACTVAMKEWDWLTGNPFLLVTKPKPAKARDRRPTEQEIVDITFTLDYHKDSDLKKIMSRVGAMFLLAIETAMRSGEIVGLTWKNTHLDERWVHLPDTKNGYPRDVPLSTRAVEILEQAKRIDIDSDSVFGVKSSQVDSIFRKAKAQTLIKDLKFHDSRREALTRMAPKMEIMQLARISGHRDLRILQNVYYAPKVGELVDLLD